MREGREAPSIPDPVEHSGCQRLKAKLIPNLARPIGLADSGVPAGATPRLQDSA